MTEELATYEAQPIDIVRQPSEAIAEAQKAAKALASVVAGKKKPVIFNGEQYLEFEDWQTVGNFYGLTAKIISTTYIEYGTVRGFEAKAVTLNRYGVEITAAESMCLNDEPNWQKKPLFQLRSMAQTRACSKTLRNVLAWVVVLAGYKPTPAEEMEGVFNNNKESIKQPQSKSVPDKPQVKDTGAPSSEPQQKAVHAMYKKTGFEEDKLFDYIEEIIGRRVESTKELTKGEASQIIEKLNSYLNEAA